MRLSDSSNDLLNALIEQRAVATVRQQVGQAVAAIDTAKATVLDDRFAAMSDEIGRWWEMLRPEEAVAFGGVKRRGTCRRYLDLTAALYPRVERPAAGGGFVERHAVAVFSDSQLNCLGMAAFLARCTRQKAPFVVLDDPVPASDEEHQATFSRYVVDALLAQGTQLVVTTHDERVSKQLQAYYNHLPADVFAFVLDEPSQGALVIKKSDELEGMLAGAQPFLRNQNPEIRKMAAQRLRTAAERLCKEIIVRGRQANGSAASLADYDGKTLGDLAPLVQPFLTKDAAHPGKMRVVANLLNPGSHDAPVPPANDLLVAAGDIKKFRSDYLT